MNYSHYKWSRAYYDPRAHWVSVNGARSPLSLSDRLAADSWSNLCIYVLGPEKRRQMVIFDFQKAHFPDEQASFLNCFQDPMLNVFFNLSFVSNNDGFWFNQGQQNN